MENLASLNPNRSKKALTVLKFIVVIFILPWVYSSTCSFINELKVIDKAPVGLFIKGIISFLAIYLFVFEPGRIYQKGQKITEATFRFLAPLVKIAPFVLPIYTIFLFAVYMLISLFIKPERLLAIFMFIIGLSFAFHLVFSAKALRSRKDDFLMVNYLFSFGLIYIFNIALLALGFSVLFEAFSWLSFCKFSFQITRNIYYAVIGQLFL